MSNTLIDVVSRPVYIYDFEVFKHDWLICLLNKQTKEVTHIWNDNTALVKWLDATQPLLGGFNNKHYDKFILGGVLLLFSPEEVKEINDTIIQHGVEGWQIPNLKQMPNVPQYDLIDNCKAGISLKSFESNVFRNICESKIDFDVDHALSDAERAEVLKYCIEDVRATDVLDDQLMSYNITKVNLGARCGLSPEISVSMTNAKLTAVLLGAKKKNWTDGRQVELPDNLDKSVIPKHVLDYYEQLYSEMTDEELFDTFLDTEVKGMPIRYGWGGVHGSLEQFVFESDDEWVIQNRDVASLYPSLIEQYHLLSRNASDFELYTKIKQDRIKAKHNGDKQTANDLKTPLNTVSGAQDDRFNDLYDPKMARSVRIYGQLFLTVLLMRLCEIESFKPINYNTDGLAYIVKRADVERVDAICSAWEKETRLELETDNISKIWIKDVSNLCILMDNGKVKTVGSYLNYGANYKGNFSINNDVVIVKEAMIEYFIHGTPVEETIGKCTDIHKFQITAKASSKYSKVVHTVGNEDVPVQKCNRVYASTDYNNGTLTKYNRTAQRWEKIAGLPLCCIIDNDNHLDISAVDKNWYINLTKQRLDDFIGPRQTVKRNTRVLNRIKNEILKIFDKERLTLWQTTPQQ